MKKYLMGLAVLTVVMMAGCGQSGAGVMKLVASPADDIYKQAQAMMEQGQLLEAKAALTQIVAEHTDYKNIEQVEQDLYNVNMQVLFSNIAAPKTLVHEVVVGDTLGKICRKYNVTMDMVKTSNGMSSDVVRVGQKLRIWTGKFSIYVDKSQNTLMLKSDDEILKVYSVSTGANNSTPVGVFKIINKLQDPVWYKAGAVIPPESPDNALGSRWLGFDLTGYGIHGTVQPDKIGQQITSGCVRMRNSDVEELYKIVPVNTEVTVAD